MSTVTAAPAPAPATPHAQRPLLHWQESDQAGETRSARWQSERGAAPPARVVLADDTTPAATLHRLASEGSSLLWRGDFHNARQLLQALARRIDKAPQSKRPRAKADPAALPKPVGPADAFHRHRLAQSQRARLLGSLLVMLDADHSIPLRRAPDLREACAHAWGPPQGDEPVVVSLRELLGVASAYEWHRKGVLVPALGERIHPAYGVFSPLRGEYVDLVAHTPLPPALQADAAAGSAFDIGTGSGVLAAVLARRGIGHVVATELEPRAVACARANIDRLGLAPAVQVLAADLFPPGRAALVVCNPPWLPARPSAPIERAVYDEGGRMLAGYLAGLAAHLAPEGEGWLVLSDLAEHLGLRTRAALLSAFADAGLTVLGRVDTRPRHAKATDANDALHAARAAEVTSLWRLAAAGL